MPPPHYNKTPLVRIPDEANLVRLAADGDQMAYGRLYTYYYPQLYSSLAFIAQSHEDTQEIIHETFLKIWKAKESLLLIRSFEDYAYTLAKNLLFNQLKRKKINQRIIRSLSDHTIRNAGTSPDQDYLYKQYYQTAVNAINQLSAQKHRIFVLRTQEGMALGDIAHEMGISVSAVKKHLYAALQSVKEALQKNTGDTLILLLLFFL
ncbi:sigma-70 family RNA polymerase sigma factor [Flavitalea sp. BT771]|uniref:RNA polymerase sigma factor n=1 Tax=Flavitalea sp. BT771 TaxID=3063329 RepID=UPI0026E4681C|nr:sigma-70 family RNA polymerase sigma factor [Flavitalea sp. BT771]MDO6434760.1 sigma-70 family RNA polymerase sigma factor [Flavitalea sp. BT771]MDV6223660.1 sigma-70 family RNA polymerase sigma factor [Flavitalea sp. BT771]